MRPKWPTRTTPSRWYGSSSCGPRLRRSTRTSTPIRKQTMFRRILPLMLILIPLPATAAGFEFKDGDRVVLIGSTLIEREQRYGYWEAALTAANPDKTITFRNFGWSGDTVWGEARAGF